MLLIEKKERGFIISYFSLTDILKVQLGTFFQIIKSTYSKLKLKIQFERQLRSKQFQSV